jgi:hypothetical protein
VDLQVAARLRRAAFDVLTTRDAGMTTANDEQQLEFATRQNRVLFTHNVRDFRRLSERWAKQGRAHAGLMYSSQVRPSMVARWIVDASSLYADFHGITLYLPVAG